jgi:hypothetical protein
MMALWGINSDKINGEKQQMLTDFRSMRSELQSSVASWFQSASGTRGLLGVKAQLAVFETLMDRATTMAKDFYVIWKTANEPEVKSGAYDILTFISGKMLKPVFEISLATLGSQVEDSLKLIPSDYEDVVAARTLSNMATLYQHVCHLICIVHHVCHTALEWLSC